MSPPQPDFTSSSAQHVDKSSASVSCNLYSCALSTFVNDVCVWDAANKCIVVTKNYPSVNGLAHVEHNLDDDSTTRQFNVQEIRIYASSHVIPNVTNTAEMVLECRELSSGYVTYVVFPLTTNNDSSKSDVDLIIDYVLNDANSLSGAGYKTHSLPPRLNINKLILENSGLPASDGASTVSVSANVCSIDTTNALFNGNVPLVSGQNGTCWCVVATTAIPIDVHWNSHSVFDKFNKLYSSSPDATVGTVKTSNNNLEFPNISGVNDQVYIDCSPANEPAQNSENDIQRGMFKLNSKDMFALGCSCIFLLSWCAWWFVMDKIFKDLPEGHSIRVVLCAVTSFFTTAFRAPFSAFSFGSLILLMLLITTIILFSVSFAYKRKPWAKASFLASIHMLNCMFCLVFLTTLTIFSSKYCT